MSAGVSRGSQFLAEIGWREFASHLLFHFPDTPSEPLRKQFCAFPWQDDHRLLTAWQRGHTGFPLIDAGMRELWATGWMHNRVRMVVGSFLVKDLLIDWRRGRGVVLGHACRCRPRQQHTGVAVGRRLWRRCRAIFSRIQSRDPGREIRSERRLRAPMGSGTGQVASEVDTPAGEGACRRTGGGRCGARVDVSTARCQSRDGPQCRARGVPENPARNLRRTYVPVSCRRQQPAALARPTRRHRPAARESPRTLLVD